MSCYGCDGTGLSVWACTRGEPCPCRVCSECDEIASEPIETLDIDDRGRGYSPCAACLASKGGAS